MWAVRRWAVRRAAIVRAAFLPTGAVARNARVFGRQCADQGEAEESNEEKKVLHVHRSPTF